MSEPLKVKFTIATLDEAPKPLQLFYAPAEDGFHLAVDGHPDTAKLAEFRDNNRALVKTNEDLKADAAQLKATKTDLETQLAALTEKYKDVDPVEYAALKGKPDRTAEADALKAKLAASEAAHAKTALRNDVALEFLRAGGQETAIDFAVVMAEKVFSMRDGVLMSDVESPTRPGQKITLAEWIEQQLTASPFLAKPSRGGGATHSPGGTRADTRPVVDGSDPLAVGRSLESIAAGRSVVR